MSKMVKKFDTTFCLMSRIGELMISLVFNCCISNVYSIIGCNLINYSIFGNFKLSLIIFNYINFFINSG